MFGGKQLPERYQKTLLSAMGVSVLFVGLAGDFQMLLGAKLENHRYYFQTGMCVDIFTRQIACGFGYYY